MEIIYRSIDGVLFKSAEECVEHEQNHLLFKMWDERGRTNEVEGAMVLWVSTTIGAMDIFKRYSEEHDCTTEGLEDYKHGLFFWDSDHFKWRYLEDRLALSFAKFCADRGA